MRASSLDHHHAHACLTSHPTIPPRYASHHTLNINPTLLHHLNRPPQTLIHWHPPLKLNHLFPARFMPNERPLHQPRLTQWTPRMLAMHQTPPPNPRIHLNPIPIHPP